jgi:hypothetical protein
MKILKNVSKNIIKKNKIIYKKTKKNKI